MSEDIQGSVALFIFSYAAVAVIAMLIIALDNFDFETTITSVITCLSNMGPGFGMVGPMGSFACFAGYRNRSLLQRINTVKVYLRTLTHLGGSFFALGHISCFQIQKKPILS